MSLLFQGMDLELAIARLLELGGSVRTRGSELVCSHPLRHRPVIVRGQRRSAPRKLVSWLRGLDREGTDLREAVDRLVEEACSERS